MQILLASAKIMRDKPVQAARITTTEPRFNDEARTLALDMSQYDTADIAEMLNCSRQIAEQNKMRYLQFFEDSPKQPAILAYHGQAYKHLKAETMTADDMKYAQKHLWITSFLYGLLRPADGIQPYRMEGKIKLPATNGQTMFAYWKTRLTDILIESVKADDGILIHLATEEYQHLFDWQRVCREVRVIQPLFYVRKGSELKVQAVWAKTCRGAMTRHIIDSRLSRPAHINTFCYEGFAHAPHLGDPNFPHFVKE